MNEKELKIILKKISKEINNENYTQAEELINKHIIVNSENQDLIRYLSIIKRIRGKYEEAEYLALRCIEINASNVINYSNLGEIYLAKRDFKKSSSIFRKALVIDKNYYIGWYLLGNTLMNLNKDTEAVECYLKALEINNKYIKAKSNLAAAFCRTGRLYEAKSILKELVIAKPDNLNNIINLANVLNNLGDNKEALVLIETIPETKLKSGVILITYANIKRDLNDINKAIELYKEAISLEHKLYDAYIEIAILLERRGDIKEAIHYYQIYNINKPHSERGILKLSSAYQYIGKINEAEILLCNILKKNITHSRAHFALSLQIKKGFEYKYKKELIDIKVSEYKDIEDKIYISFAKANMFHKEKNYIESCKWLIIANNFKKSVNNTDINKFIKMANTSFKYTKVLSEVKKPESVKYTIFLVGVPRCGSTLIDSILACNDNIYPLGESTMVNDSLNIWLNNKSSNYSDLYYSLRNKINCEKMIYTDKNLYNFFNTPLICTQLPEAKIIYCMRNNLDNIISIYRTNFSDGNFYSTSIEDCAKLIILKNNLMNCYMKLYPDKIYKLQYEQLVQSPKSCLSKLFNWLNWEWDDKYLSHQNNERVLLTASKIQARSAIYTDSVDDWKNYEILLKKVIEDYDELV